jgi:hypothetical protein
MARIVRRIVAVTVIAAGCGAAMHSAPATHAGGVTGTGGPLKSAIVAYSVTLNGGISGTGGPLNG